MPAPSRTRAHRLHTPRLLGPMITPAVCARPRGRAPGRGGPARRSARDRHPHPGHHRHLDATASGNDEWWRHLPSAIRTSPRPGPRDRSSPPTRWKASPVAVRCVATAGRRHAVQFHHLYTIALRQPLRVGVPSPREAAEVNRPRRRHYASLPENSSRTRSPSTSPRPTSSPWPPACARFMASRHTPSTAMPTSHTRGDFPRGGTPPPFYFVPHRAPPSFAMTASDLDRTHRLPLDIAPSSPLDPAVPGEVPGAASTWLPHALAVRRSSIAGHTCDVSGTVPAEVEVVRTCR